MFYQYHTDNMLCFYKDKDDMYRGVNKGLYVLLSRTHSGRTIKQEQEEFFNHVQTFINLSVLAELRIRILQIHSSRNKLRQLLMPSTSLNLSLL